MIDGNIVVEGVAHGYNFLPENAVDPAIGAMLSGFVYEASHCAPVPPEYRMPKERWDSGPDPMLIAGALFAESQTDLVVYHETPIYGYFKDGGSAMWVGHRLGEYAPDRVLLYGAVSPFTEDALERIDAFAEDDRVVGIKLYPTDLVEGRVATLDMSDPEVAYPLFERARQRGIKVVAIHKSIPLGPVPIAPFHVTDVDDAAMTFPDLTFEIVHGGWAFVEETAMQLLRFHNVVVNLEGTSAYVTVAPRRFIETIGAFLAAGAEDRIIWATGCMASHPRPLIEAFWHLDVDEDLTTNYGIPEFTPEMKAKILGRNFLRMHGIDEQDVRDRLARGQSSFEPEFKAPWSGALVEQR